MLAMDLQEIQELDSSKIIQAKLNEAIKHHQGDLIVEDNSLEFESIKPLPGPLIKWFLQTLGNEGLYQLAQKTGSQKCTNGIVIGYYNHAAKDIRFFESKISGTIVAPKGNMDFGWGALFKPDGADKTYGEMDKAEKEPYNPRIKALRKLQEYLENK